ncbi:CHASE2 domain-containing protein [uncultured Sphingorhabdus sp.]|uniref:CHASE2 domain-containing protein n=1 Tax=uncultured Sphingorhabdus sp. TaxID=1686106 RepID=UPI0026117D52|nr:CHASE2 domain-containing protein [uncultured Sphingorhabdus sp.]HMS20377.1 CHASE2 domain-containing protein [Sphingorhabdus sp.]
MANTTWTHYIDNLLLDSAIPLASGAPSSDIIIVEIDERSLNAIGEWPWDRSIHAELITKIAASKPKVIAYDVLFIEPKDEHADRKLALAVADSGKVVLPLQYQIPGSDGRDIDLYRPFEPLTNLAARVGHVGLQFDPDGIVRRAEIKSAGSSLPYKHLMEAASEVAQIYNISSPATEDGKVLLPLLRRHSYQTVPAVSVLQGELPPQFLKNRLVLVGATAQGMGDNFPVSAAVGSAMPGIEIQANLLNGLMSGRFMREAAAPWSLAVAIGAIFALMLGFWHLSPRSNLVISLLMLLLLAAGSWFGAVVGRLWISPGPALMATLLVYPLWGWRRLSALNDFVEHEANRLSSVSDVPRGAKTYGLDAIATRAARLRLVLGELTNRQNFVEGVVGAAPDAIFVIDETGKILLANNAARTVLSENLEQQFLNELLGLSVTEELQPGTEWQSPAKRVYILGRAELTATNGTSLSKIISLSDITAIRAAETERKEMLEFLSHDMRAPQAAILSLTHTPSGSAMPIEDLLRRIKTHAEKTLKLADDFVQLARLSVVKPDLAEFEMVDLMREAADDNFTFAQSKNIKVIVHDDDSAHYVLVDGSAILRAIGNLINNAIKYSPAGATVDCYITRKPGDAADADMVICEVKDQGPGIPEIRLRNLFDRFGHHDAQATISAGLGLSFVKSAVEQSRGTVECQSSAEQGTTFRLAFAAVS